MSIDNRQQCLDDENLQLYLNEELGEVAESNVARHINECEVCQVSLEEAAGHASAWDQARNQLIDHLPVAPCETVGWGNRDRDRELEQLKAYLGPTDDPEMMGRLGRYEVRGLVGRGSTGIVVKALEPQLNRYVAIKILSPLYSSNGAARSRFEREARSVAAVINENVVPIYAVDEHRGLPYIVMQYVSGGSLLQRIEKQGPLQTCEVARVGMQVARGLAAAHEQGIVHRDVKPANVMMEDRVERAMVSDFGLARVADEAAMTRSGVIAGTPQFMSPEQARGEPLDARSDLFSLGSVLYTACTGRPPFRSESVFGVIKKVCDAELRPIREVNPDIDFWLEEFVDKLLQKDRENRFSSANEVAELLSNEIAHIQNPMIARQPERSWIEPKPGKKPSPARRKLFGSLALLVATLAVGASLWASGLLPIPSPQENQSSLKEWLAGKGGDEGPNQNGSATANGFADSASKFSNVVESKNKSVDDLPGKAGQLVSVTGEYTQAIVDGYQIYLPISYGESDKQYPVILSLAGGCYVGGEIDDLSCWGMPEQIELSLQNAETIDMEDERTRLLLDTFIVVSPHMIEGDFDDRQFHEQSEAISEILDEVSNNYQVDGSRVYVTGGGRGGHGTWGLASIMPERFAAIAPIRGKRFGIKDYKALETLPIWLAHCLDDQEVNYGESAAIVRHLEKAGTDFHVLELAEPDDDTYLSHHKLFTSFPGTEWPNLYEGTALYKWLLTHRKTE